VAGIRLRHATIDFIRYGIWALNMDLPVQQGVILFAHGARDARWAEPFQRLASVVRSQRAAAGDPGPVGLAYLELMEPDLRTAIDLQVESGCGIVTVIPVFFGQGSHLRNDLPALLETCCTAHPQLEIRCTEAVGEVPTVLEAIAHFCMAQIDN
jgi:sirohydrochlorin cobaltochelatase